MDDDKPYSITLDPSYSYSGGAATTSTVTIGNDYTESGTFTIDTSSMSDDYGSINWGNDIAVPADGDIKIGDRSLKTFMDTMEKRMAILQPDPKKLEKFEALQKAYEHYKHLEKLCELEEDQDSAG